MKIGISRYSHGAEGAAELVRCASASGFAGIQFKTSQLQAWDFRSDALDAIHPAARAMAKAGVVFHPDPDPAAWSAATDAALRFATEVGAEHVCYCSCPQATGGTTHESVARALAGVGERYARAGIAFSFHNHTGSLMATQADLERLCAQLDPAVCGLTYDTAHAAACGITDLAASIERLAPAITNVHLKDLDARGAFCPLGRGRLALGEVVEALARLRYAHWLIVDEESADVGCAEACRISMDFIAANGAAR